MMADSGLCFDVLSNGAAPEMAIGYKCALLDHRSLPLAAHAIITVRPDGRLVRLNRVVHGVGTHPTFKRALGQSWGDRRWSGVGNDLPEMCVCFGRW